MPFAAIEDRHDVGVRERCCAGGLAPEALDELLVLGEVVVQELHRNVPAQQLVFGEVYVCHPPGTHSGEHAIAPVDDRVRLNHEGGFP